MHHHKSRKLLVLAAGLSLLFTASVRARTADDAVAYVDGTAISARQLKILENSRHLEHPNAAQRGALIEGLIDRQLLVQQAEKAGLDKSAEIKALLDSARETILARAAAQHYLEEHPISDKEIRTRYDELIAHLPAKQYELRAILVKTKADAGKIKDELDHGADFAELAKAKSLLPEKRAPGGELGWRFAKDFVPPVAAAIRKADRSKPSAPVWTPQGWWVVEVQGTRPTHHKPYAEAKDAVRGLLANERVKTDIAALRKQAKVKLLSGS